VEVSPTIERTHLFNFRISGDEQRDARQRVKGRTAAPSRASGPWRAEARAESHPHSDARYSATAVAAPSERPGEFAQTCAYKIGTIPAALAAARRSHALLFPIDRASSGVPRLRFPKAKVANSNFAGGACFWLDREARHQGSRPVLVASLVASTAVGGVPARATGPATGLATRPAAKLTPARRPAPPSSSRPAQVVPLGFVPRRLGTFFSPDVARAFGTFGSQGIVESAGSGRRSTCSARLAR